MFGGVARSIFLTNVELMLVVLLQLLHHQLFLILHTNIFEKAVRQSKKVGLLGLVSKLLQVSHQILGVVRHVCDAGLQDVVSLLQPAESLCEG